MFGGSPDVHILAKQWVYSNFKVTFPGLCLVVQSVQPQLTVHSKFDPAQA